jgi:predicted nuclease with TOPRIM domain
MITGGYLFFKEHFHVLQECLGNEIIPKNYLITEHEQRLYSQLGKNDNNQEIKKLQIQIDKLEQMIGKLTMENYVLKKEKECIIQRKKEDSSIKEGCRLMDIKR